MKKIIIQTNLQFFASKKGTGSTKNGRDSQPKYLGAKKADGEFAKSGQIIYRQRGTRVYPGANVGMGTDHTLFAMTDGIVKYVKFKENKTKANIINQQAK